jgi:hypothetical protein
MCLWNTIIPAGMPDSLEREANSDTGVVHVRGDITRSNQNLSHGAGYWHSCRYDDSGAKLRINDVRGTLNCNILNYLFHFQKKEHPHEN